MQPISRLLEPIRRLIRDLRIRGVLLLNYNGEGLQRVQVSLRQGEVADNVEAFQDYGFASRALPGAAVLRSLIGAAAGHVVVDRIDDPRYRKNDLADGEVALYTHRGDYIHIKDGRVIEVVAGTAVAVTAPQVTVVASTSVTIDSPSTTITGDCHIQKNLTVGGTAAAQGALSSATSVADPTGSMASMRSVFDGHNHVDGDGKPTTPPQQQMGGGA